MKWFNDVCIVHMFLQHDYQKNVYFTDYLKVNIKLKQILNVFMMDFVQLQ